MPLEYGLWRIDGDRAAVEWGALDLEERLEGILDRDITVAASTCWPSTAAATWS